MFNLQGSELIIILLLALVVLGPEKLPEAMRRAGRAYSDLKKMASGFQQEFNEAMAEPLKEVRETADLLRDSADFTALQDGEREEKPKSAEMGDALNLAPADPDAVPTENVPFSGTASSAAAPIDEFNALPSAGETAAVAGAAAGALHESNPVEQSDDVPSDPFGGPNSSASPKSPEPETETDATETGVPGFGIGPMSVSPEPTASEAAEDEAEPS